MPGTERDFKLGDTPQGGRTGYKIEKINYIKPEKKEEKKEVTHPKVPKPLNK